MATAIQCKNQSILKEINPEYLLEGLMLKAEALIFLPPGVAVSLEKTLESPLDCKEIQPVHPKEISPECSLEGLLLELKAKGEECGRGQKD